MGFNRRKMEDERRHEAEKEAAAHVRPLAISLLRHFTGPRPCRRHQRHCRGGIRLPRAGPPKSNGTSSIVASG
jgi:hypothetical protein